MAYTEWQNTKNYKPGTRVKWIDGKSSGHDLGGYMTVEGYNGKWCMVVYDSGRRDGHPDELLELVNEIDETIFNDELFKI